MGISDKIKGISMGIQDSAKNTSYSLAHILFRLATGVILGLTLALIGQEVLGYSNFSLVFFMLVVTGLVFKVMASWSGYKILIFDLFCILVAMLFRMYILVAP